MGQPHHQHRESSASPLFRPSPHESPLLGNTNISPISLIHRPWSSLPYPTMAKTPKLGPIPHLWSKSLPFPVPRSLPGVSLSHPIHLPGTQQEGAQRAESHWSAQAVLEQELSSVCTSQLFNKKISKAKQIFTSVTSTLEIATKWCPSYP